MKYLVVVVMLILSSTSVWGKSHQQEIEDYLLQFDTAVTQIGPLGGIQLNRHQYQPYTAVSMMTPEAMMAMEYWGIEMTMPKPMDLWSQIYFIGDFMNSHEFVNLAESKSEDRISFDNYSKGLRYKQTRSIDVGIGYSRNVDSPLGTAIGIPMGMDQQMLDMMQDMMEDMMAGRQPQQPPQYSPLMQWFMDLRLQGMIGLSPIIGSTLTADRFVESKEAVAKLPKLKIPRTKEDLHIMRKGDLLTYNTHGGILFNAALGVALPQAPAMSIGVGVDYFAQGNWTIKLLKVDEHKVMASMTNAKLQSFKLLTFMGVHRILTMSVEKERFKEVSNQLSFIFDLNDPEVEKLYQNFLEGNVKVIQERVYEDGISGIVSTTNTRLQGKVKSRNIKLTHFIRTSWTKGFLHSFSTKRVLTSGVNSEIDATLYLKGKESRFFSRRKKLQSNFISYFEKRSDGQQDYAGEFILTFESNKGKSSHLKRAIKKMIEITGISELKIDIPRSKQLGFTAVDLRISLNKKVTQFLTKVSALKQGRDTLFNTVKKLIVANEQNGDPLNICTAEESQLERELCFSRFTKKSKKILARTIDLLNSMRANLQRGERKLFTRHYAEFGELLLSNRPIFTTYFELVKGQGLSVNYKILGSRINFFEKHLTWK